MNKYPAGVAIDVTIPFVDLNGDPVTPTALSAEVLDENDEVLTTLSPDLPGGGATEVVVSVPANMNTLAAGDLAGARTVELQMTTAAGVVPASATYIIQAPIRLVVPSNSFQTYSKALVEASTMPEMIGWEAATAFQRQNALMEAYQRITKMGFWIRPRTADDGMNTISFGRERNIAPDHWVDMTANDWAALPADFRQALRRAQIAEAAEIVSSDTVSEKRRAGILSESIGESSMMFRTGKPLDMGVSAESFNYLVGYVRVRATLARA